MLEAEFAITPTLADARFAKPLDQDLITDLVSTHSALITIEEGARGGFGAFVLDFLHNSGHMDNGHSCKIRCMTLPDCFQDQDKPELQYETAGLNAGSIVKTARTLLK